MARLQSSIYNAEYSGGWEAEIRIADQTVERASSDNNYRNNICIQVKKAFQKAYPNNDFRYIEWQKLKLVKRRSAS